MVITVAKGGTPMTLYDTFSRSVSTQATSNQQFARVNDTLTLFSRKKLFLLFC